MVRQSLEAVEEVVVLYLSSVTVSLPVGLTGSPGTPACSHTFLLTVLHIRSERTAAAQLQLRGAANKVLRSEWKHFKVPSSQNRQAFHIRGATRRNGGWADIAGTTRYPN